MIAGDEIYENRKKEPARILQYRDIDMEDTPLVARGGHDKDADCGCVRVMDGEIVHRQNCPRHDERFCKACNPWWQRRKHKEYLANDIAVVNGRDRTVGPPELEVPVDDARDNRTLRNTSTKTPSLPPRGSRA